MYLSTVVINSKKIWKNTLHMSMQFQGGNCFFMLSPDSILSLIFMLREEHEYVMSQVST